MQVRKINTGEFAAARIPNLAATKINSGTFDAARIPNLAPTKITQNATNRFVTDVEKSAWNDKQDKLTAGNNISITDNVISIAGVGGVSLPYIVLNVYSMGVYSTYVSGFELVTGMTVAFKFEDTSLAYPSIRINTGTGQYNGAIRRNNVDIVDDGLIAANSIYLMTYDGTFWQYREKG